MIKPPPPRRIEPKVAKYLAMVIVFAIPLIYKDRAITEEIQKVAMYGIIAIWLGADVVGLGFAIKTLKAKILDQNEIGGELERQKRNEAVRYENLRRDDS